MGDGEIASDLGSPVAATAPTQAKESASQVIAAVDLGSNSFHMVVARAQDGQLVVLDRLREMVRLAAGIGTDGDLDAESQTRALDCLARFGERLRDIPSGRVRVVGTNTLRLARRPQQFLAACREALGHPVEIISGIEEARLVYMGVARSMPPVEGRTLVIDIGGGSTEVVLGDGYDPKLMESLFMGCVGFSHRFFAGGQYTAKRFERARVAAALELAPVQAGFVRLSFERALGSSGTARAVAGVARELGLTDGVVTPDAVSEIEQRMVAAHRLDHLALPGLTEQRAPVFAGGLAIMASVLEVLGIDRLKIAEGALREGVLYDLLGRLGDEDSRELTVTSLMGRYHVDTEQASRVAASSRVLFDQVADAWSLTGNGNRSLLRWAALLHEVGLDIAHAKYHQHGAYLIQNGDLPGFIPEEQRRLAALVGTHRRKFVPEQLEEIPEEVRPACFHLSVLLRLSVLLNRNRFDEDIPAVCAMAGERSIELRFPPGWLKAHPLTEADLLQEKHYLGNMDFELRVLSAESA